MNWHWKIITGISDIPEQEYNKLSPAFGPNTPFLHYSFLLALEESGCVSSNTGWQANHILVYDGDNLVGFILGYVKSHSYGEYVFDHSWAHAYAQYGLEYYPKWINAVPFTPVTGTKIKIAANIDAQDFSAFILANKSKIFAESIYSSIHFLFSAKSWSEDLHQHGLLQRQSVQFNWHNKNYANFDDFLDHLTARKRKSIKKERRALLQAGVKVIQLKGEEIQTHDLEFFYQCYKQTYLKRSGHEGYLNADFFERIMTQLPNNLLLVIAQNTLAEQGNQNIAAALFVFDQQGLYGRYWGAMHEVSGLHFEACYYQGIEFCIANNIPLFNPGTQGEHKIFRGFEPTFCYSNHYLFDQRFHTAVQDFLQRETPHIIEYYRQTQKLLPFKQTEV